MFSLLTTGFGPQKGPTAHLFDPVIELPNEGTSQHFHYTITQRERNRDTHSRIKIQI